MKTFEELGVAPMIIRAIQELGFENPMPVQEKVIPLMLENDKDIVALAQTGTGKTAAFGLPLVQQIDAAKRQPQVLVLCPTRELCMQITGDLTDFAKYCDDLKILPVYGGSSIETQMRALRNGVHVIVATPGRLVDLIERKAVKLASIKRVVLDEADEMLNMGFTESITTILAEIPSEHNTLLFSATMPSEISRIAKNYMTDALEITVGNKNAGAENVKHLCYTVHAKDKYHTLKRIADFNPDIYGIVFCRTRIETQEIADKLIQDGYNADSLHGDLSQSQRDYVMQKFRVRNISLLVATDVAARGLDVNDLTHVINFGLPDDLEAYIHRSGRTGRAGKTGISVAIINLKEKYQVKLIEKKLKKQFISSNVPTGREICEKQLFALINRMEKVEIDHSQIDTYLPVIYKKLEWLEKEDLIKRFVSLEFNSFLDYYRDAKDINTPSERDKYNDRNEGGDRRDRAPRGDRNDRGGDRNDRGDRSDRGERRGRSSGLTDKGYTRLFINMGKMDNFYPNILIEMLNKNIKGDKVPLGQIDLLKNFSFFEVDSNFTNDVIKTLGKLSFNERQISVEVATERKDNSERRDHSDRHSERRSEGSGGSGNKRRRFNRN